VNGCGGGGGKASASGQEGKDNQHPSALVGVWITSSGDERRGDGWLLVFFEDGTAFRFSTVDGRCVGHTWKVDKDRLHLSNSFSDGVEVVDYAISGSTLTISGDGPKLTLTHDNDKNIIVYYLRKAIDDAQEMERGKAMDRGERAEASNTTQIRGSDEEAGAILERVKNYVSKGADVNARLLASRADICPLDVAARTANVKLTEFLISKGANVKAKGKDTGATPLHMALWCNWS
jgi:hypothetical protein